MPFWVGDRKKREKQSEYGKMGAVGGYNGDVDAKYQEILERKKRKEEEKQREREERLRREQEDTTERFGKRWELANRKKQKSGGMMRTTTKTKAVAVEAAGSAAGKIQG
jgi:hypothetical protein